jgi:hypothetical protein
VPRSRSDAARLGGIPCGVDLIANLRAERPERFCVLMTADIRSW